MERHLGTEVPKAVSDCVQGVSLCWGICSLVSAQQPRLVVLYLLCLTGLCGPGPALAWYLNTVSFLTRK